MARAVTQIWDHTRFAHPRFDRVRDLLGRFAGEPAWPTIDALDAALAPELRSVEVRLVEAPKTRAALDANGLIDPASLYEVRIVEHGEIPSRPHNLHDLLNALVWAAFPQSKLALTRRLATIQRARAAGRSTLPSTRTREHDRLAMIDEGALLHVTDRDTTIWIFGHAIYEHTYAGDLAVRGAAVDLTLPGIDELDLAAARAAIDHGLASLDLATVVRDGPGVDVDSRTAVRDGPGIDVD